MWEQVFAPVNPSTLGVIEQNVYDAVARWEPRVELTSVDAIPSDDGSMISIEIAYQVNATTITATWSTRST